MDSSTQGATPKPQIISDEDWKERVKAEDAAIDQQFRSAPDESAVDETAETTDDDTAAPEIDPSMLPPASFATLVSIFSTQAMAALGLLPGPSGEPAQPQPALARHFIDLLSVIEEKTRGNLSQPEERLLENTLHELRMAFVHLPRP